MHKYALWAHTVAELFNQIIFFPHFYFEYRGRVAQRLGCCATNRTLAGSIPAGVIGIFHLHKILPIALWPWATPDP